MWGCSSSLHISTSFSSAFLNFMSESSLRSIRTSFTAMSCPVSWSSALKTLPREPWPMTSPGTQLLTPRTTAGLSNLWRSPPKLELAVAVIVGCSSAVESSIERDVMPRGPREHVNFERRLPVNGLLPFEPVTPKDCELSWSQLSCPDCTFSRPPNCASTVPGGERSAATADVGERDSVAPARAPMETERGNPTASEGWAGTALDSDAAARSTSG
mmetsp:Transcript_55358/g.155778  ORF Transcript_55358/g.155778 Transcript_55358/m.155778 type:complete len:215 (-) Transcript_55358:367-1011(-)